MLIRHCPDEVFLRKAPSAVRRHPTGKVPRPPRDARKRRCSGMEARSVVSTRAWCCSSLPREMLKGVSSGLDLPLLPRLWKFGKKSNWERNLTNFHRSRYRACGNSEGNLERNSENTKNNQTSYVFPNFHRRGSACGNPLFSAEIATLLFFFFKASAHCV